MEIKFYSVYENNTVIKNFINLESAKAFVEDNAKLHNEFPAELPKGIVSGIVQDWKLVVNPMWLKVENTRGSYNLVFRAQYIDCKNRIHQYSALYHIRIINLIIDEN